jgi:hypothetical protein
VLGIGERLRETTVVVCVYVLVTRGDCVEVIEYVSVFVGDCDKVIEYVSVFVGDCDVVIEYVSVIVGDCDEVIEYVSVFVLDGDAVIERVSVGIRDIDGVKGCGLVGSRDGDGVIECGPGGVCDEVGGIEYGSVIFGDCVSWIERVSVGIGDWVGVDEIGWTCRMTKQLATHEALKTLLGPLRNGTEEVKFAVQSSQSIFSPHITGISNPAIAFGCSMRNSISASFPLSYSNVTSTGGEGIKSMFNSRYGNSLNRYIIWNSTG